MPQGKVAHELGVVGDPEIVRVHDPVGHPDRGVATAQQVSHHFGTAGLGHVERVEVPQPGPVHHLAAELGHGLRPCLAEAHVGAGQPGHGPDPITQPAVRANDLSGWNRF